MTPFPSASDRTRMTNAEFGYWLRQVERVPFVVVRSSGQLAKLDIDSIHHHVVRLLDLDGDEIGRIEPEHLDSLNEMEVLAIASERS